MKTSTSLAIVTITSLAISNLHAAVYSFANTTNLSVTSGVDANALYSGLNAPTSLGYTLLDADVNASPDTLESQRLLLHFKPRLTWGYSANTPLFRRAFCRN